MRVDAEFRRPVRTILHTCIPLADGSGLAARIWLPEGTEDHRRSKTTRSR
jgi:uncharacterized protein